MQGIPLLRYLLAEEACGRGPEAEGFADGGLGVREARFGGGEGDDGWRGRGRLRGEEGIDFGLDFVIRGRGCEEAEEGHSEGYGGCFGAGDAEKWVSRRRAG